MSFNSALLSHAQSPRSHRRPSRHAQVPKATGIRSANRRLLAWTGAPTTPAAEREAAEELVLSCCLLHDWIMNEHLRESEVQLRASDRSGCGRKTSARLTSRLTYEAVLCAALGLETADGLESSGLEPTPYLGLEAISLGSTQRLPSLTDQASDFHSLPQPSTALAQRSGECLLMPSQRLPQSFTALHSPAHSLQETHRPPLLLPAHRGPRWPSRSASASTTASRK